MNSKMTTSSQLSMTEPKKQIQKQSKQTTTTGVDRITEMEITQRVISWEGKGANEGKGAGIKQHNW